MKRPATNRRDSTKRCSPRRRSDCGYVLLVLILFVTLLAIAVTVTLPSVMFEMKRDREEELIHRGTQYTRAIKHYYKKFSNYPTSLEQLENTNQVRFLRHRYKDPITGKDFKLLYMQDVQTSFSGPGIQGATSVSQMAGQGGVGGPGGFGGQSGFGGQGFGGQQQSGFGFNNGPQGPGGGFGQNGFGQSSFGQSSFGQSTSGQSGFGQSGFSSSSSNQQQNGQNGAGNGNGTPGDNSNGTDNGNNGGNSNGPNGSSGPLSSSSNNQVFGGGPIVGVTSTSKDKSIRIYNKKERYNQWQFVYNPAMDTGGILSGPGTQSLQGATPVNGLVNGANGQTPQGGQGLGGTFGGQPGQPIGGQPGGGQPITQPPQMPPEQ
ncbi:MAG TPA: hypothetical protein VF753_18110 [Terriglobales bacterium]